MKTSNIHKPIFSNTLQQYSSLKKIPLFICLLYIFCGHVYSQSQINTDKSLPMKEVNGNMNMYFEKTDLNIFFWQDFESDMFPPANWTIVPLSQNQTWKRGDNTMFVPYSGQYFAICRYDETYNVQDERLYTPILDTRGLSDATLSFYFVFSKYWGISPHDNYDLQVLASTDGGVTFPDTIWTELSTDTASWRTWEWVRAEVDITDYIEKDQLQFCFRYVGFDGADAAIDDVSISFVSNISSCNIIPIAIYPNPAKESVSIIGATDYSVQIYDALGRKILSVKCNSQLEVINFQRFEKGLYHLIFQNADGNYLSKKLLIE
jgi:hypothetical protein